MRTRFLLFAVFLSASLFPWSRAEPLPSEPLPSVEAIPDKDVRELLTNWLAAQNQGNFPAYEALYAQTFTGIRRSGPRTVYLERAGWMIDRQRMFRKKMTVNISDIRIEHDKEPLLILFRQTFQSGTYQDVGTKQMRLQREGGVLRIGYEEMLNSQLTQPSVQDRYRRNMLDEQVLDGGQRMSLHQRGEMVELLLFPDASSTEPIARGRVFPPLVNDAQSLSYLIESTPFPLSDSEVGFEVYAYVKDESDSPDNGSTVSSQIWLFRRVGGQLRKVLDVSGWEEEPGVECAGGRETRIVPAGSQSLGMNDLLVKTRMLTSTFDYRRNRCLYRANLVTQVYRWKGQSYAASGKSTRKRIDPDDDDW